MTLETLLIAVIVVEFFIFITITIKTLQIQKETEKKMNKVNHIWDRRLKKC